MTNNNNDTYYDKFSFFFFFVCLLSFPPFFCQKKNHIKKNPKAKFLHKTHTRKNRLLLRQKHTHIRNKSGFWEDDDDDEFDEFDDDEFDDEFDQKRRSDRVLEEGLEKKKREECSLSFDRPSSK